MDPLEVMCRAVDNLHRAAHHDEGGEDAQR